MTRGVLVFLQIVAIILVLCGLPMMFESFLVGVACSGLGLVILAICTSAMLIEDAIGELRRPPVIYPPRHQ